MTGAYALDRHRPVNDVSVGLQREWDTSKWIQEKPFTGT